MRSKGPWCEARVRAHLTQAVMPLRLACATPSGWPVVLSLWYLYRDGALWCATPRHARVVGMLAREPRCGFEVAGNEPPYRGVRGRGRAHLEPAHGAPILRALVERYLGPRPTRFSRWLLERPVEEVAIRIELEAIASWDFTDRMSDGGA